MVCDSSYFDSTSNSLVASDGKLDALSSRRFHLIFALSELERSASQKTSPACLFGFSIEQRTGVRFFTLQDSMYCVTRITHSDLESNQEIVDSAASITLEDYPLLWSDTDFISANDSMVDDDRDVEQNSSENQRKTDLHVEEASRDSIINPTKAVSNCDKIDCRGTENDSLLSKLLNKASDPEVLKLRKKCRGFEHGGKLGIGSGLLNRGNICYRISVLQFLYHNEQFRRCLLRIDDQSDNAFTLATLFHRMACGATQGAQELPQIQDMLSMGSNDDAAEAFRKLVELLQSCQNRELAQTIQSSFFLKLVKFQMPDLTATVSETGECMIPLSCIGHATLDEAMEAQYAQFEAGGENFQWSMKTSRKDW
jgi:hypothetical protein